MYGVFDIRPDSGINQCPKRFFQIKNRHLKIAKRTIGDIIVYREVSRGGGCHCYIATAIVTGIKSVAIDTHNVRVSGYKLFPYPVPFNVGKIILRGAATLPVVQNYRMSVRTIRECIFWAIYYAGSSGNFPTEENVGYYIDTYVNKYDISTLINITETNKKRKQIEKLMKIKERDARFRTKVMEAYKYTCAFTGITINNGKGLYEAQAAHIQPVADDGPDHVINGIALSSTCHWLFDRHLISLTDDYRLLIKENSIPSKVVKMLILDNKCMKLPTDSDLWPKVKFIRKHRKIFESV